MFDIGWSEMAVIALIALIVIGPKDLPGTLKTIAHWLRKARSLTREFQSGIDDMVREAELDDAKKALEATRGGNLEKTLSNALDPDDAVGGEVRALEREARSDGTKSDAGKGKDSNAERAASKMVIQPASVAPPHSLTPPSESTAKSGEAGAVTTDVAGSDSAGPKDKEGSKQTA
jgi:sec-independent protein translocase protein TatB